MSTKLKPWHKLAGITPEGAHIATDEVLAIAEELLTRCGYNATMARILLDEAKFRLVDLPKRTARFRTKYLKDNK